MRRRVQSGVADMPIRRTGRSPRRTASCVRAQPQGVKYRTDRSRDMSRSVMKVVLLAALVVAGWMGLSVYEKQFSSDRALNEEREKRKAAEARAEQLNQV